MELHADNVVFAIDWFNQSNKFVTGCGDSTVAVWDIERVEDQADQIHSLTGHLGTVKGVACHQLNES